MGIFRRKQQPSQEPEPPDEPVLPPEFRQLIEEIPEPDDDGSYFWQPFAERLRKRFEGIPGTDGTGSFWGECLKAGADAVPVVRRNTLWEKDAPDRRASTRDRKIYELRIRLGIFYAASLRFLVQGITRLRVRCGDAEWHGVTEEEQPFSKFAAGQKEKVEVRWTDSVPSPAKASLIANAFFTLDEALLLTPKLAEEVYEHVVSADPTRGLFGLMLARWGQAKPEKEPVDVAGVFLDALAQTVGQKLVGVNRGRNGHVFVTPSFWFVTSPIGVEKVLRWLGQRRQGRRYDFSRREVMEALVAADCLVGMEAGRERRAVRVCDFGFTGAGAGKQLALNGLAVRADRVPGMPAVEPLPEGVFTLRGL